MIKELGLPSNAIIALIERDDDIIIPKGNVRLQAGDVLVIGSEALKNGRSLHLTEVNIGEEHAWNGMAIKDLDISRKMLIVMIKREGRSLIPYGDMVLNNGDVVIISDFRKR